MKAAQVKLIVSGRVQGVFYRHSTKEKARALGLSGWVKNLANGSVEICAIGQKPMIDQLIEWCRSGPPNAQVENVSVEWQSGADTRTVDGGETCAPFGSKQGKLQLEPDVSVQSLFEIR